MQWVAGKPNLKKKNFHPVPLDSARVVIVATGQPGFRYHCRLQCRKLCPMFTLRYNSNNCFRLPGTNRKQNIDKHEEGRKDIIWKPCILHNSAQTF